MIPLRFTVFLLGSGFSGLLQYARNAAHRDINVNWQVANAEFSYLLRTHWPDGARLLLASVHLEPTALLGSLHNVHRLLVYYVATLI